MGERLTALEKIITEADGWISFSESGVWQRLKEKVEKEIITPAKEAFHNADIDGKTNEEIVRNTISQRSVIKTAVKVIDMVEKWKVLKAQALKDLMQIEKSEAGSTANNRQKGG